MRGKRPLASDAIEADQRETEVCAATRLAIASEAQQAREDSTPGGPLT